MRDDVASRPRQFDLLEEFLVQLGITPLAENNPADEYLYEVIVGTGIRRGAGTASTVCMQLNGERSGTAPFTLRDPHRKVLKRGNVDRFLLAAATYVRASTMPHWVAGLSFQMTKWLSS